MGGKADTRTDEAAGGAYVSVGQWCHILICDLTLLYNFSKAFSFINLALKDEIFLLTDEE